MRRDDRAICSLKRDRVLTQHTIKGLKKCFSLLTSLKLVRINTKVVMPTVLREKGYRFVIYPNDHQPAHVHVIKAGGEIKVDISQPDNIQVITVVGMKNQEALTALKLVRQHQNFLLSKWEEIHE